MSVENIEELFQSGLERYRQGEAAATLIPLFEKVCDRQPKIASGWICLSWLYLLEKKSESAVKAAKQAVKLSPEDPQGRINLAIALLETNQKGVRDQIEAASNLLMILKDLKDEIVDNFKEGASRRSDWQELEKVRKWLLG
jgi:predicted Zn-dependent protease